MAIDEAAFRYSMVPFWVTNEWRRAGITVLVTPERAREVADAVTALRVFVDEAGRSARSLVAFSDQREGMSF